MIFRLALLVLFALKASAQECSADGDLCDAHKDCSIWKEAGECQKNEEYMKKTCPVSCLDDNYPTKDDSTCKDYHTRCEVWASLGECTENPKDMKRYCALSCNICNVDAEILDNLCVDKNESCSFWSSSGECEENTDYMMANCAKSCGNCGNNEIKQEENVKTEAKTEAKPEVEPQLTDDEKKLVESSTTFGELQRVSGAEYTKTLTNIRETLKYMKNEDEEILEAALEKCKNENKLCAFWAGMGECENNEGFMLGNCAPSCQVCDLLDER